MSPDPTPLPSTSRWQQLSTGAGRLFHEYANWLVSISWKRFFVLSLLLLIGASILESLPPFCWSFIETISGLPETSPPSPPKIPRAPVV